MSRLMSIAACLLLAGLAALAAGLAWLRFDAHADHRDALVARHGVLVAATREPLHAAPGLAAGRIRLQSASGLEVIIRTLKPVNPGGVLPVLVLLGGHRTGSDAVALFEDTGPRAIVALDYPYEGEFDADGVLGTVSALPQIRQAFFDASPAIWLTVDWLISEPWVDANRIVVVGISLGVPFAATAAARDPRIAALMLVHGAADNRAWIAKNVERRLDLGPMAPAVSSILNWVVYGPLHDTPKHVAEMTPRPVVIVGARDDERVPAGETERLYAAAGEPKRLRWTEGRHVRPGRRDIIDQLIAIAGEELEAVNRP